ncbi:MAG: hypothetical protein V1736_08615 [Pseudomonadota bacterium]
MVKKRGNRLGFWFFRTAVRLFGLSGAYGLLYPVCLYYLALDRAAVSASLAYIGRRFRSYNFLQRTWGVYELLINQGKNLIDRYYLVSGHGRFDIEIRGLEKMETCLNNPAKGFILLTAHVGNWQVTMTALARLGRVVCMLMRPEDNAVVKEALGVDRNEGLIRIISSDGFLGGVVEATNAIREGSLVSIMGDRSYGYGTTEVKFLGEFAGFPYGAFGIAAAVQCPVFVLLSAKTGTRKYVVEISQISVPPHVPRKNRHEALTGPVQEFADILDSYVTRYPFQWFVFDDIWQKGSGFKVHG